MNTLCERCSLPLFEHASDFMVREGHACRGDCKVKKPHSLPVPAVSEPKANKYGATRCECLYGHIHASKKEMARCIDLHILEKAREITDLEYEPVYEFRIGERLIGRFSPDFRYLQNGAIVVEDVKSVATARRTDYRLRKKMMKAFFDIDIVEV